MPVLFVGRAASPEAFGVFLVAYGAVAAAVAVSRAMFGVVVGMDSTKTVDGAESRLSERHTNAGVIACGLTTAGALLIASPLLPHASSEVALLALGSALVMPQDLTRYTAVARANPNQALLLDAMWCVPCLVVLALEVGGVISLDASTGVVFWVLSCGGSVVTAALLGLLCPPRFVGLLRWWVADRRRRELGGDSLLSGAVPVVNGWGAAAVGGSSAVASVRGAAMLFAPVMILMQVLTIAAVPEALRRDAAGARRLLFILTGLLTLAALGWGLVTVVLPDSVGRAFLGDSWAIAQPVLPWVCLEYLGVALWTGGAAMLRYSSDTRKVFGLRLAYAPAAAVLPVALLGAVDEPQAFAAMLAALAWIIGPLAIVLGIRALREGVRPPVRASG